MKNLTFKILALLLLVINYSNSIAIDKFEKKAHYNWTLDNVNSLSIDNKFGSIHFSNDVQDSVIIIATITIEETSEKKGNHLLDQINISKRQSGRDIFIKTEIDNSFKSRQEFAINYDVVIPANKPLKLSNKFGNIYLDNLLAEGKFNVEYGNIEGESINSKSGPIDINISYGNGQFDSINNVKAKVSYGKLAIAQNELADIYSRFSVISFDNCIALSADSKYDTYKIESIGSIVMNAQFTESKIEEVHKKVNLENKYGGGFKIEKVNTDFDEIKIQNNYAKISIGISDDANYQLQAKTKFCKVYYPAGEIMYTEKNNRSEEVKANIGQSPYKSKIFIESSYGNVDLKE